MLIIEQTHYSWDEIKRLDLSRPHNRTTEVAGVLRFCQAWLRGQAEFTVHTSGSTGQPKPITLTRAQMVASARLTGQALRLQAGDRALVCLATQYIAGLMMLVRGLELGLSLTVIPPTSTPLATFSASQRFEFSAFVPLQLQKTLQATPDKRPILDNLKALLIGGAPLSLSLTQQLQSIQSPVYHTYGMTETVTHIALKRLNGSAKSEAFVPLPGVKLGTDGRGCLTIRAAVTRNETIVTNDVVDLQADGSFIWLGRWDNVINSGGVKVQAERVERALARCLASYADGVLADRRFFVDALPHSDLGQQVVALIEGEGPSDEIDEVAADIRTALRESGDLSRYEIPRQIHFLPHLVETPTGKIDRQASLARLSGQSA